MKRYFNMMEEKQVVMVECPENSIITKMDICSLFGTNEDIVEIHKREFILLQSQYQKQNKTNMKMTIVR